MQIQGHGGPEEPYLGRKENELKCAGKYEKWEILMRWGFCSHVVWKEQGMCYVLYLRAHNSFAYHYVRYILLLSCKQGALRINVLFVISHL